jgi:hypothetical protein
MVRVHGSLIVGALALVALMMVLTGCGGQGPSPGAGDRVGTAATNPFAGTYYWLDTSGGKYLAAVRVLADGTLKVAMFGRGLNGLWFAPGTVTSAGTASFSVSFPRADPKAMTMSVHGTFSGTGSLRKASGTWVQPRG